MAVNTLTTSGKWATNGNWGNAHKPEAKEDVTIPAGKEVKIEAAAECRSLYVEKTAKVTGGAAVELKIGNGEKPEGGAGASWALKVDSEVTVSAWKNIIVLTSTAAETQKIGVSPTLPTEGRLVVKTKSTAKYLLEVALTTGGELKLESETWFDSNGFDIKVTDVKAGATKVTFKLHASTVTVTKEIFEAPGAESTFEASGATLVSEVSATGVFTLGGYSYGTLTVASAVELKVTGANTFGTVNVNNKGVAAGKGLRFAQGSTQTITTLTTNGTEGSPARLESTEAGKAATIATGEQTVTGTGFLKIKDITVTGGPVYAPFGTDEGGNSTVGTTLKFEAKPTSGPLTLGMIV